jgi:nitrite reductase/ring-hydroxylating ferredoxin subunit
VSNIEVARSDEVFEGEFHAVKVGTHTVLLTRSQGKLCAIENKCPHLGLPVAGGSVEDGVLRCPWHGARFEICSGRNLQWANSLIRVPLPKWSHGVLALGREPAPIRTFETVEKAGAIFVKPPKA